MIATAMLRTCGGDWNESNGSFPRLAVAFTGVAMAYHLNRPANCWLKASPILLEMMLTRGRDDSFRGDAWSKPVRFLDQHQS
jgi:hypothetical protein